MDILLKRVGNRLAAVTTLDQDKLESITNNEVVSAKISRPRNIGHHRKFFALLQIVFDNQDHYTSIEAMRKVMTMKAGFYEVVETQKGEKLYFPESISFTKMDQDNFENFYNRFLDVAVQMIGLEKEDIIKEIEQF